jgi:hypothetical protein
MKKRLIILSSVFFCFATIINAQFGINAKGGIYIPVGELSNNYNNGLGGEIIFIYAPNKNFELGLVTGYSHYNADENILKQKIYDELSGIIDNINLDGILDVSAPLNIFPATLNVKYLFGNRKMKPYFFFEGGIFFYNLTMNGHIKINNGPTINLPETVEKDNSTMLAIGGGFKYRITKKLFFDASAKWSIMNNIKLVEADKEETIHGVDRTAQNIGIIAGLNYSF